MTQGQPPESQPVPPTNCGTAHRAAPDPDKKKADWRLSGFVISRRSDFVAFAALVISIVTASIQLSGYIKGAQLKLLPPDQVFIVKDAAPGEEPRARFGATLIYVNTGEKGYNAIIRRELVHVVIAGKDYEQGWDEFVTFDGFTPNKPEPAKPFSVDGGDATSHQTYFIPWPKRCPIPAHGPCDVLENHIHWGQFMGELNRLLHDGQREFEFKFAVEVINDKPPMPVSCKIEIDDKTVKTINQFHGYNPTCFSQ
jgi:hypothetical protein